MFFKKEKVNYDEILDVVEQARNGFLEPRILQIDPNSQIGKIAQNKKLAYMSRSLGEIFTNIKMDENLENYRVKEPNYEDLRADDMLDQNAFAHAALADC